MTKENFCYWLQGYFEIHNPSTISARDLKIIKEHLNLALDKKSIAQFINIPSGIIPNNLTKSPKADLLIC